MSYKYILTRSVKHNTTCITLMHTLHILQYTCIVNKCAISISTTLFVPDIYQHIYMWYIKLMYYIRLIPKNTYVSHVTFCVK